MDNVINLHPQQRNEEKIKKIIRETLDEIDYEDEDRKELENIIFRLYADWFHNTPDLKIKYVEGTLVEVIRQIEDFYQGMLYKLLCALAAEKFAHYKNKKNARQKNNNNKDT